jgi:orotidine-5'-phosphate decarboxylase
MSRLIVALDYDSGQAALELVRRLDGVPVGMFKVGSELFTTAGPALVLNIAALNRRVFLDLKFHDIPNTVASAVAAASRLGVALLNVHAAGGLAMMRAARQAVAASSGQPTGVIAVTLLTSLAQEDLARLGFSTKPADLVLRLAEMAAEAGLDGVVASAAEAAELRRRFPPPFLIVVPGIRPSWATEAGDQRRVSTPAQAIASGADYIVVGRPITRAPDPREAAQRIIEEIAAVR